MTSDPGNRSLRRRWLALPLLAAMGSMAGAAPVAVIHHQIEVDLQPDQGRLVATDRIRWPDGNRPTHLDLILNAGLALTVEGAQRITRSSTTVRFQQRYRITLGAARDEVTLHVEGVPRVPALRQGQIMPSAVLDNDGVYLDAASAWYPQIGDAAVTVDMTVRHPTGWHSVTQGQRLPSDDPAVTRWSSEQPQETIYLLAGPYHLYTQPGRHGEAEAFLRSADGVLAQRYLAVTDRYLDLYSRLIGPYPYPKFAVVENRWETGYGMPSFTLLGPRVMRLPFILTSSYPHEILHNWWGNSVYPDYASGNWSEGLTSYLADHLLQEQAGLGAKYRRSALQKYADYVASGHDFPLREFRARHNETTQAVGYGKSLMLFHMLRRRIGDGDFTAGLQRLYRDYRFQVAGFDDLRREFEAASGESLAQFFAQWVERTGAPAIALERADVKRQGQDTYRLRIGLRQTQSTAPYDLRVPVAITLENRAQVWLDEIVMTSAYGERVLELPGRPLRLDVDPRFDLFRRLAVEELPSSLGQLFGAQRLTVVIPNNAASEMRLAYQRLAADWQQRYPQLRVQDDDQPLPDEGGVWVLGADNRHTAALLARVGDRFQSRSDGTLRIGADVVTAAEPSVVLTWRRDATSTMAYAQAASPQAVAALARKLPHYGKYSYLVFSGSEAVNVLKGDWQVDDSPLSIQLVRGTHPPGKLPAATALID